MTDALSFALFGKSHRKISKPQLVNSINEKGLLVEARFRIGSRKYVIVRGIKPNKFEIWVDGKMINQSSHAKDYQSLLEKNILKLNHKSFHQIVVLGSSSFIPFMQLNSQSRRDVIEDLLDINMFSKMNSLMKERTALHRSRINENDHRIDIIETKISGQKKLISELEAVNDREKQEKQAAIDGFLSDAGKASAAADDLTARINAKLPNAEEKLAKVNASIEKMNGWKSDYISKIRESNRQSEFFRNNEHCPTCDQEVEEVHRNAKIGKAEERSRKVSEGLEKLEVEMNRQLAVRDGFLRDIEEIRGWQTEVAARNAEIRQLNSNIKSMRRSMEELGRDGKGDLPAAQSELVEFDGERDVLKREKFTLHEESLYQQVITELLKDGGIKSKIIKQYLPVINKLTNEYLQTLDFFVYFELDEGFVETIRSRHRDNFTYDSFSEGEKQRIDLSLLFTWRQIAKMKNSVATNLLILDETFDSSLDMDGVDNLLKILQSLGEDTNVFVISHKSELEDASFERKIEFVKKSNFSKIKS